jgi:hypothetical protein
MGTGQFTRPNCESSFRFARWIAASSSLSSNHHDPPDRTISFHSYSPLAVSLLHTSRIQRCILSRDPDSLQVLAMSGGECRRSCVALFSTLQLVALRMSVRPLGSFGHRECVAAFCSMAWDNLQREGFDCNWHARVILSPKPGKKGPAIQLSLHGTV